MQKQQSCLAPSYGFGTVSIAPTRQISNFLNFDFRAPPSKAIGRCFTVGQPVLNGPARLPKKVSRCDMPVAAFERGYRVTFASDRCNGSSAPCAQRLAAEIVRRFEFGRQALPCTWLPTDASTKTAIGHRFDTVPLRPSEAQGRPCNVSMGITNAGKLKNAPPAFETCRAFDVMSAALFGLARGLVSRIGYTLRALSIDDALIQNGPVEIGQMQCPRSALAMFGCLALQRLSR